MDYVGALHHVMVRGIERRAIFIDDQDRARFLFRLEEALRLTGGACLAWALMPNHVHLLLRTGVAPLAVTMHRLGTNYAMDFNRRHGRAGHLFQNRYKALPVENDAYVLEVVRYIHLNPVRAGIVPDIEALGLYPWTGHRALMGRGRAGFQSVDLVLGDMGASPEEARQRLREWMDSALPGGDTEPEREPQGGGPESSSGEDRSPPLQAGTPVGPGRVLPTAGGHCPRSVRADILRLEGWDLRRLIRTICEDMGVSAEAIRSGRRSRRVSRARAVIAWFAWTDLGLSQEVLAVHLGVAGNSLSERMEAGRALAEGLDLDPFMGVLRFRPPIPPLPGSYPQKTE
ncbi:MAG: transposase [Planctomycetaceae bacterium]|nr:transposase [Planctomycetota bacterium]NUN51435.1 transposase [Planctomycetaceae bacterium]